MLLLPEAKPGSSRKPSMSMRLDDKPPTKKEARPVSGFVFPSKKAAKTKD